MCIDRRADDRRLRTDGVRSAEFGFTLIELIVFIVIISIALAAILLVMNKVTGHSADTLTRKQSLAIAESLLEEVELQSFTWCDPNDLNAASAVSATDCTAGLSQDVITGPIPNTETRYSAADPFDNVADYSAFHMSPILDISGNDVGLGSYTADVAIARAGVTLLGGAVADDAALRITVTVTGPDNIPVQIDGYRARYAPNALP